MGLWVRDDVRTAFTELLEERRRELDGGGRHLGWKLGFGTAAAQQNAGIDAPLVGYLLAENEHASGSGLDVAGWTKPIIEPEIAVYLGADVPAGASDGDILCALAGISLAYELVDATVPFDDAVGAIGVNLMQRGVVLGERRPVDLHPGGVSIRFAQSTSGEAAQSTSGAGDGAPSAETELAASADPAGVVGGYVSVIRHLADVLGAFGETLRAGDAVITGMVTPPVPMRPGTFTMSSIELGSISLQVI